MKNEPLKLGDRIKDNDPRCKSRAIIAITRLDETYAYADNAYPKVRIRLASIHTDGKPRRSGFNRIDPRP